MEEILTDLCPLRERIRMVCLLGLRGKMRPLLLANRLCNYILAIYPGEVNFLGITH